MGVEDDRTIENKIYGTGWPTCRICKITDVAVVDGRCSDETRCRKVLLDLPLGPPLVLEPPVRFDLDADEQAQVVAAVVRWQKATEHGRRLTEDETYEDEPPDPQ